MIQGYDGAALIDSAGEKVGSVERSYVDDRGAVQLVEVKTGGIFSKHRLVPADDVEQTDDGIVVPYDKATIERSPDASDVGDTLERDALDQVRAYYAGIGSEDGTGRPAAVPVQQSEDGADTESEDAGSTSVGEASTEEWQRVSGVRDRGDVIEVPIVEEEIVKRPVVKEVLRVRKSQVADTETVSDQVRKEDIEVEHDDDIRVTGDAVRS